MHLKFLQKYKKFYLFIFLIDIYKLGKAINKIMKTKKVQPKNKKDILDKFLSILWRKEVGDLKYTLKI